MRSLPRRRLRAEAAEALARSESEGKKNVELLSEIGREITASLDFDTIFGKLYERVNQLADADVFGVGLYHPDRTRDRVPARDREGQALRAVLARHDRSRPAAGLVHRAPRSRCSSTTCAAEYQQVHQRATTSRAAQLEDGSMSQQPQSLIYLPLIAKDRVLGIITIQSFEKNAYTEHHLNVMQSLASYTAIALDNAERVPAAERARSTRSAGCSRRREQARAIAEEADAAKSAFLSTVSHELRTPLTSVLGFAKIIKKRLEDRIFPLVTTDDRKVAADDPAGGRQPARSSSARASGSPS